MNALPIRLSLCMATMNRSEVIAETFAAIAGQDFDGVELVIVDGSRDDATERVLEVWRPRLPPVRYERLKPQGFDRDYHGAIQRAAGEYCWLIADDDPWNPGAVAAVRRALGDAPDFVVVNGELRGPDLSERLESTMMPLTEDRIFRQGEDDALAAVALSYLSYVGAVVVRRTLWMARRAEPFFGTDFVHVGVLFQQPIERLVVVIATPYVNLRFGVAQWSGRSFDIWMFQWPRVVWSFPQISDEVKKRVTRKEPWRRLQILAIMRATGHYARRNYVTRLAALPLGWWHRLTSQIVAALPVRAAGRLARWYFACRGRDVGRLAWELRHPCRQESVAAKP